MHTQAILAWYQRHQRDLPWRKTNDPYKIWISEIMLQQTQVETVKPYYARFFKKFPTVSALAKAPLDTVLKAWEGLGYYSRARHLHKAAQIIVKQHRSKIPRSKAELLKLPGIGRYTAGAILSIAFGQDEAAVDGNLQRVLSRLFSIESDLKEQSTQEALWLIATQLLPHGQAGLFNQALMDLGSSICIPGRPRCLICPLTKMCEARKQGRQTVLPVKTRKKEWPHYEVAVGVIYHRDKILIAQRPNQGLLAGLWEFPGGKREAGEPLKTCVRREIQEELGINVKVEKLLGVIKQGYSHFKVTLHAFRCHFISGEPVARGCQDWKWVKLNELNKYAFPAATHKIIATLEAPRAKNAGQQK